MDLVDPSLETVKDGASSLGLQAAQCRGIHHGYILWCRSWRCHQRRLACNGRRRRARDRSWGKLWRRRWRIDINVYIYTLYIHLKIYIYINNTDLNCHSWIGGKKFSLSMYSFFCVYV